MHRTTKQFSGITAKMVYKLQQALTTTKQLLAATQFRKFFCLLIFFVVFIVLNLQFYMRFK